MVHGILLARVHSNEVDDLVHDVFLQALRHLHTLRDKGAFGGWLCRITRNRRDAAGEAEFRISNFVFQFRMALGRHSGFPP